MFMLLLPTAVAFVPVLKADTFEYKIISSDAILNVTFDLSSFENPANNITTLSGDDLSGTVDGSAITAFGISGNSSACAANGVSDSGPCWVAFGNGIEITDTFSPTFSGVGTHLREGFIEGRTFYTIVTITDLSTVPEPSAIILLASVLVAVGFITRRRRASRQRAGWSL
jgi:hypothetical protein